MHINRKTRDKIIFIHTLNWGAFFWLLFKKHKIDKVFYSSQKINSKLMQFFKKRLLCEQINLHASTCAFLQNEKNKYAFIEKLFEIPEFHNEVFALLSILNLKTEKLVTSFKKHLLYHLSDDVKIITLAMELGKSADIDIIVNEYGLLKGAVSEILKIKRFFSLTYFAKGNILFFIKTFLYLKKILFQKEKRGLNSFAGIKIIFEQMYKGQEKNPEFGAFYRYFKERDDVLYICISKDSEIYKTLRNDKKPVLVKTEIPLLQQRRVNVLTLFILFFRLVFSTKLKTAFLKGLILRIFYEKMYYEAIFKEISPSFYLKIRSDIDPAHPVATAVAEKYNVKHIGYQHGAYYIMSMFAYIDFHYYGLLGKCFLEGAFSKILSRDIQYSIIGPITVESMNDNKGVNLEKKDRFIIGIFTNIYDNNRDWQLLHQRYMEILCCTLSKLRIPDLLLVFKEKGYSEWSEKLLVSLCNKFGLSYEIAYHLHPISTPSNYSKEVIEKINKYGMSIHLNPHRVKMSCLAEEVIAIANIVVEITPYGHSTATWEALGKKRKIVIFRSKHLQHPFEKYIPELLVGNKREFEEAIKFLVNISQEEYEEYIQPAIENCCKVSDGNLVKNFIESVEDYYKRNSFREYINASS